jgi:hypothetical protein
MPNPHDPPLRPSELKRVQELLSTIEIATNQLKDELVNVRAREDVKKKPGKTLAEDVDKFFTNSLPLEQQIETQQVIAEEKKKPGKTLAEVFAEEEEDENLFP